MQNDVNDIVTEFKNIIPFIDRYKFYQKNQDKIRYIDEDNPLSVNFVNASKELDDGDIKNRNKRRGAIYVTPTDEYSKLQENKNRAIIEREKHYDDKLNGLNEPKPKGSFEYGQLIEYKVSNYTQDTFESLRDEFLLKYGKIDNRGEYLKLTRKETKNYLKSIERYGIDLVELSKISISNNEFNFELFYDHFKEKEKEKEKVDKKCPPTDFSISYENLAKIIPYVLFANFLKGLKKSKPDFTKRGLQILELNNDNSTTAAAVEESKEELPFDNLFPSIEDKEMVMKMLVALKIINSEGKYLLGSKRGIIRVFIDVMKEEGYFVDIERKPILRVFTPVILRKLVEKINKPLDSDVMERRIIKKLSELRK